MLKVSKDITDLQRQSTKPARSPQLERGSPRPARVGGYELHFEAGRRSLNDPSITQDDLFSAQRA